MTGCNARQSMPEACKRRLFQSSTGPRAGCNAALVRQAALVEAFQSTSALQLGATVKIDGSVYTVYWFQSSTDPWAKCNIDLEKAATGCNGP